MSLMKCPECGGQVSDQAAACPHCGYVLKKASAEAAAPDPVIPDPTEIEGFDKTGAGIQSIMGLIISVIGVALLFFLWPIGLAVIAVGAWLLNEGGKAYAPKVKVICPWCKKSGMMERKQTIYGCPNCKKMSAREKDRLYPMQ